MLAGLRPFFGLISIFVVAMMFNEGVFASRGTYHPEHPLYIGVNAGFGSTTWDGLVPNAQNQNPAMSMTTPVDSHEGGLAFGVFIGYEWTRQFALEASYMQYPEAIIWFDPMSLYSFTHDGEIRFFSRTEALSLMAKIFLTFPDSTFRMYSSAGAASIHREDAVRDEWRLTPSFGVGLNFMFNEHVMGEIAANYTAGFGESMLNPTDAYFPFLYSVTGKLAYRF